MKKITILLSLFYQLQSYAQPVINISTGVSNATGALLSNHSPDDTWKVYTPGSSTTSTAMVHNNNVNWPNPVCGSWITPMIGNQPAGDYIYETKFYISCNTTTASMTLGTYACDNTFDEIQINGNIIPFLSGNTDDIAMRYGYVIPNMMPYIHNGTNTLRFVVHNRPAGAGGSPTGLLICGQINTNSGAANNPEFTLAVAAPANTNFFYRNATPVVTNANLVPGFGEMYIIERMNNSGFVYSITSAGSNPNPPCWWVYPTPVIFRGYNGSQNVSNVVPCKLNGIGKFPQCYKYRITRGTWNNYCPWAQYSVITEDSLCDMFSDGGSGSLYRVDTNAPDFSYLKPAQASPGASPTNELLMSNMVFPNPGNGLFTLKTSQLSKGTVELYDLNGILLKRIELRNNKANTIIDLSGYQPGTYTVRIITESKASTEKIVLIK